MKILLVSALILLALVFLALGVGSVDLTWREIFSALFGDTNAKVNAVVLQIRLPRILLAIAVGGGLSVAGAVLQSILKNPLAEPYILGVSSGGTFGALVSMLLGFSFFFTQLFSFVGSLIVIALILFLSNEKKVAFNHVGVLLAGVMIGAFFGAAILIVLTLTRENLQTAVFWLVGSLSFAEPSSSYYVFAFASALVFFLSLGGYKLNLIAMENAQGEISGVNIKVARLTFLAATGVLTGALVSVSGVVGFIGMIVPHLVRNKFGFDNRAVVPISFFAGGALLLIADTIARTVILPAELPVGAITAFFGAPVFIWILKKKDYYFSI